MQIAIMGAGAMGSLLGGKLSGQHSVLLIGRDAHMRAIRESGLVIEGVTETTARPQVCTSPHDVDFSPDIVFITVKAYDTEEAAKGISEVWPDIPIVVSMQNGIGNAEIIGKYLSNSTIVTALTTHGATFLGPGRIRHAGVGRTVIGHSAGQYDLSAVRTVQSLLEDAGFGTEVAGDIRREVWIKAGVNASINPITSLLREKNGVIVGSEELTEIVRDVSREVAETASAAGIEIDAGELYSLAMKTAELTADNRSSMLQDILAGRQTEIERINGEIVRRAEKLGVDVPVTRTLYRMVKAAERTRSFPGL